jgi:hypothetical protein
MERLQARRRWVLAAIVAAASVAGGRGPGASVRAAEPASASWTRLKALVGDWSGTYDGQPARVSYRLVSNGTALLETLEAPDASEMLTLYHPDGAVLALTHYCSLGNQTRMLAKELPGGRLDFGYLDATNLKSPDEHRMTRLVLTLADANHLVQEWTSRTGSTDQVARFEFTRRK